MRVLERYFDAIRSHDWESLADFADDGRIRRVDIYIKTPPGTS